MYRCCRETVFGAIVSGIGCGVMYTWDPRMRLTYLLARHFDSYNLGKLLINDFFLQILCCAYADDAFCIRGYLHRLCARYIWLVKWAIDHIGVGHLDRYCGFTYTPDTSTSACEFTQSAVVLLEL